MSLLTFRSPAYYAACHHCGNALRAGDDECTNCGVSQSRALVASNAMVFNNRNFLALPSRMLVSYPSVPEEVDTARNIARQRARKVRRAAFGLTLGAMVAGALALAYGPGMRSAAVMRLAEQPEPSPAPPLDMTRQLDTPVTNTVAEGFTDTHSSAQAQDNSAVDAAEPSPVVQVDSSKDPEPAPVSPPVQPVVAQAMAQPELQALAQASAPVAVVAEPQTPPVTASAPAQPAAKPPVASSKPLIDLDAKTLFAFITPEMRTQAYATLALAEQTVSTQAARIQKTIADVLASHSSSDAASPVAKTETIVAKAPAEPVAIPAPVASPVPSAPEPTADVPLASHATQLAEPVIAPTPQVAEADPRPASGTPAESLYLAKLALAANDLTAVHKDLAALPANQDTSEQATQIRDELALRENMRNAAMLRARACDSTGAYACARKSAKEALGIDTSYGDARLFLKRVYGEVAAKKAKQTAAMQTTVAPAELHATADIPSIAPANPIKTTPSTHIAHAGSSRDNQHDTQRDTRDARELREAKLELDILEARAAHPPVREPVATAAAPSDSIFTPVEPIRPAGRGDAH